MKRKSSQLSIRRKLVFSFVPLIALFLISEIGLRTAIYQYRSQHSLATVEVLQKLRHVVATRLVERRISNLDVPGGAREILYTEAGQDLLEEFQARYEKHFSRLVQETQKVGSMLLVMYLPSDDFHKKPQQMNINRAFFADLCDRYRIPFLDLTDKFLQYPSTAVTLLPEDNHFSRFGHQIVAAELGPAIKEYFDGYKSDVRFEDRPRLLGDFRPNENSVWTLVPSLPFHVRTNSQGLRMNYELEFPKRKQRILILGDSQTFGPFLHNHDIYPSMLNELYPDKEFVNAAVQGYTILEQLSLFVDRARFVEPDITVLQVLDNDFYDFYYFRLNIFDRDKKTHAPSRLEEEVLERLRRG